MLIQIIKNQPRLFLSFSSGTAVAAIMPADWGWLPRFLAGWNISIWMYLLLMIWLMKNATEVKVAQLAEQEDRADLAIVGIMSFAAAASLIAIVLELATVRDLSQDQKVMHYLITIATVTGSWFFIATIFTFHYAKLYYRSPADHRALLFPDLQNRSTALQPNFWDFLYFSFTIAVAAQTSDVVLGNRVIRKTALAQSVLSFWFNMAVLGLCINIAAGLIGA